MVLAAFRSVRHGVLFGRGAADMTSSIVAVVAALGSFISDHPGHRGSMAVLPTSDEEGDGRDGIVKVMEDLKAPGEDRPVPEFQNRAKIGPGAIPLS